MFSKMKCNLHKASIPEVYVSSVLKRLFPIPYFVSEIYMEDNLGLILNTRRNIRVTSFLHKGKDVLSHLTKSKSLHNASIVKKMGHLFGTLTPNRDQNGC